MRGVLMAIAAASIVTLSGSAWSMRHEGGYDVKSSPGAWCAESIDPTRCMRRAEEDHRYCVQHDPDHYATCRHALDSVGRNRDS